MNNVIFGSICKTPSYRLSGIGRNKYILENGAINNHHRFVLIAEVINYE
nr:hypothetical protein [Pedobacter sp. ASV19]